jgi:hypothetical protein
MSPRFRVAHKPRLHLSRRAKLMIYAILGATWGSGVLWLVFHYLFPHHGEFGDEAHPLEHPLLVLHGAGAFAALWLGGWLWPTHIQPWWNSPNRRDSGIILIALGAWLVASGYLLYYASGDELRHWAGILHWAAGLGLAAPLLVHALRSGRYRVHSKSP